MIGAARSKTATTTSQSADISQSSSTNSPYATSGVSPPLPNLPTPHFRKIDLNLSNFNTTVCATAYLAKNDLRNSAAVGLEEEGGFGDTLDCHIPGAACRSDGDVPFHYQALTILAYITFVLTSSGFEGKYSKTLLHGNCIAGDRISNSFTDGSKLLGHPQQR